MKVAIDGPGGAGKSTIARAVAAELGVLYVDTGAMYRAIGLYALRRGVNPADRDAVADLLPSLDLRLSHENGEQRIFLGGEDVSEAIRTPEASMASSAVSAHPEVRAFLLERQRSLAREQSVIMDGRDIGTVVLPDADVKIFLTASAHARAERRYKELAAQGKDVRFEDVLADLEERDRHDSTRVLAPLRPAEDAILLDTTSLTLDQSVKEVLRLVRQAR